MTLSHGTDRLESARLVLLRIAPDDLPFFARLHALPEVAAGLHREGRPRSPKQTAKWLHGTLASHERRTLGHLAVLRKEDGALIGRCGLTELVVESATPEQGIRRGWFGREGTPAGVALNFECELGFTFDPAAWAQGFATEAARCVRDHARDGLRLSYAISAILPHNARSRRIAERLGARASGQMDVIGRTFDRFVWPLAAGGDTRLQPDPPAGVARSRGKSETTMEREMQSKVPSIIDLNAETAKLTMFRGLTPQTKRAERKGSAAQLPRYRDGLLLLGKSAGTGHWETHPEDELVHILDGTATLDIVHEDGPHSFALGAGMIAIVPPGVWHRFRSADGKTTMSAVIPGEHIDLDVDDPRTSAPDLDLGNTTRPPSIIDLHAELAKLTMFRGRTPRSTMADRTGSSARLASYRDGTLSITKFAGKGHWESHRAGDELIHILDGTATLEMLGEDGPQSFALRAGMIAVNPQGAWHRFSSADGVALLAVTPSPSEVIDLDVDDPRTVERQSTVQPS